MRDDEQHWYNTVEEGLLYIHSRAAVTLFDDVLLRAFSDRLASHLPVRVLLVGTEFPQDFLTLIDREYGNIAALSNPGAELDATSREELLQRIRELDQTNHDLRSSEESLRADACVAVERIENLENDLAAARLSLRRMVKDLALRTTTPGSAQ